MYSFNPYKILNVEEGATPKEIKSAYRKLSLLCAAPSAAVPSAAAATSRHRIHAPSASVITSAAGAAPRRRIRG